MNNIFIKSDTEGKTPLIDFKTSGELKLEGSSFPENPVDFYEPLVNWINDLKKELPGTITMTIKLEYFNTASSKLILYMFKSLESIHLSKASAVKILWLYNKIDTDMLESGKDYKSIISVPFDLVEYA
jgi:hypothetical protein